MRRVGFQFQKVVASSQPGDIDPVARRVFAVNISPTLLYPLVIAIVAPRARIWIPRLDVLHAKADLSANHGQCPVTSAQAVFGKASVVIMTVAGVEIER